MKLLINTVTSFLNFCQWRIFRVNCSCYLELRGLWGVMNKNCVSACTFIFHSQYWNLLRTGLECLRSRADVPWCSSRAPVGCVQGSVCWEPPSPSSGPCSPWCWQSRVGVTESTGVAGEELRLEKSSGCFQGPPASAASLSCAHQTRLVLSRGERLNRRLKICEIFRAAKLLDLLAHMRALVDRSNPSRLFSAYQEADGAERLRGNSWLMAHLSLISCLSFV